MRMSLQLGEEYVLGQLDCFKNEKHSVSFSLALYALGVPNQLHEDDGTYDSSVRGAWRNPQEHTSLRRTSTSFAEPSIGTTIPAIESELQQLFM